MRRQIPRACDTARSDRSLVGVRISLLQLEVTHPNALQKGSQHIVTTPLRLIAREFPSVLDRELARRPGVTTSQSIIGEPLQSVPVRAQPARLGVTTFPHRAANTLQRVQMPPIGFLSGVTASPSASVVSILHAQEQEASKSHQRLNKQSATSFHLLYSRSSDQLSDVVVVVRVESRCQVE